MGTSMTPADLWAEIQANPDCAPHIVPSLPKVDAATARAGDQAIADILSASRVRIEPREVGDGAISLALGVPAGPIFMWQLELLATTPPASDADPATIAQFAVARQAWRSVSKAALDVGNAEVRSGLDMFVGTLLTQEQADAIKALAEVPDVITIADVSRAVRGPRG